MHWGASRWPRCLYIKKKSAKKQINPPELSLLTQKVQKFLGGQEETDFVYFRPRLGSLIKLHIDDEFDDFGPVAQAEDEVWCMHGKLFIDGTSSGDVIQGQLGDCWFLGALAVMGSREELLQECYWPSNKGKYIV